jgi:hypothetical protein
MMEIDMSAGSTYFSSMRSLRDDLETNRQGFEELVVTVPSGATATLLLNRHSLYIAAFRGANGTWYRFKDDQVPQGYNAVALPEGGNYNDLGGLDFQITKTSLAGIECLGRFNGSGYGASQRKALRQLIVAISESLRFANTITWMMAALNLDRDFEVSRLAREIRNWSGGSRDGSAGILIPHI